MEPVIKILRKLFPKLFFEIERKIYCYVNTPKGQELYAFFNSEAYHWFLDLCRREYLYRLDGCKDEKQRNEIAMIYQGIVFVEQKGRELAAKFQPKQKQEQNVFGLDDDSLIREAMNGTNRKG